MPGSKGDFLRWTQRNSIAERYHALLRWLLRRAEHFYGSHWLSWQDFGFSLSLAYLYLVLAALLGYALANNAQVAGLEMFPAEDNALLRWLVLLMLLIMTALMVWILRSCVRISTWYNSLSQHLFGSRSLGRLLLAMLLSASIPYGYYLSGSINWTDIALAGASASALSLAGAIAIVFTAASALTLALAGAILLYLNEHDVDAQILLLLYLLLPLTNALFDCVSVKYSRYFSTRIAAGEGARMVSKHLLWDTALAVLFFFGLLLALPPFIDGCNWLFSHIAPLLPPIDWRELALQARDDPWGAGFLVTLMLLSTLIPTLLHLLMAGVALGGRGLALGWFARGMQHSSMYVFGLAIWAGILAILALAACYWTIRAFIALFNLDITGTFYDLLMLVYANDWQYVVLALVSILLLTLMFWRLDDAEQIRAKAQARPAS